MTPRTLAIIQANVTDLLPGDVRPEHYVIGALRRSRRIDGIVIAAPDTPANQAFVELGHTWGVDVLLGPEYDLIERMLQAAGRMGAAPDTVLVRVLMNRFYLDIELVDRMVDLLRSTSSDFVMLPYDFDINFGGDVLSLACLRRADGAIGRAGHGHERFRPWLFIEDHPELFRVATCTDVPSYPRSRLDEIRASGLFAERDCMTCSTFTYDLIAEALGPDDIVLDIACGSGEGTGILARRCREVHGSDLSEAVVAEASARGIPNARFEVQDGCNLTYHDGAFSVIVNSNTLEHVDDDEAMLRSFHRVLRPGGRLILETPLLRRRPFGFPLLSSHLREYDKDALIGLLERCGFAIEGKRGMNRGMYLDWERAREAVLVDARKTS